MTEDIITPIGSAPQLEPGVDLANLTINRSKMLPEILGAQFAEISKGAAAVVDMNAFREAAIKQLAA